MVTAAEEPVNVLVTNAGHGYLAAVEKPTRTRAHTNSPDRALINSVHCGDAHPPIRHHRQRLLDRCPRSNGGLAAGYSASQAAPAAASEGLRWEVGPLVITALVVGTSASQTDCTGRSAAAIGCGDRLRRSMSVLED